MAPFEPHPKYKLCLLYISLDLVYYPVGFIFFCISLRLFAVFGYFFPSANKCWAICHQGPPLHHCNCCSPASNPKNWCTKIHKHIGKIQIWKCTNAQTQEIQKMYRTAGLFGGKCQVGGGDLLSIRKPSAVILVSAGRIYFIICPRPHIWKNICCNFDKFILKFGQIHRKIWTITFWSL